MVAPTRESEAPTTSGESPPRRRSRVLLITVVSLLVLGGAVTGMTLLFVTEEGDKTPEIAYFKQDEFDEGYILVNAHVIQVDLEEEHMVVDLEFTPIGRFDEGDSRLAVPLEVDVSSAHHDLLIFPEGRRMEPREVTLSFYEGQVQNYPYDEHRTLFEMLVSESGSAEGAPVELDFLDYHHGYAFNDELLPASPTGYVGFDVHVQRSPLVVGVATMWMVIVWGLTAVMIGILIGVLTNRIKADFALFGYMTGFLLALFFIRELFPDIPSSVGVRSDFMSIFLAEAVAALVAISVAIKWMHALFTDKSGTPQEVD